MRSITKLLIVIVMFGCTTVGCGPKADPAAASSEPMIQDEEAYAAEMAAERAKERE